MSWKILTIFFYTAFFYNIVAMNTVFSLFRCSYVPSRDVMQNAAQKHTKWVMFFGVDKKADTQLAYWYNSIVRLITADGRPDVLHTCNYSSLDVINFPASSIHSQGHYF
jgi:hypothetical protein